MSTNPQEQRLTNTALDRLTKAIGDRYRVEQELGAGGMATVYLARDLKHDRRVALKVLKPELAAVVGAERFLSEIKTTANLQHPHILALFDSGTVDGSVFYAMPYVDGESLRDRLTRERQLPIADALRIAQEVADALQHAHSHGVIHRDIKPENVLLQGGHALVADFGIALAASSAGGTRMTETGMSLGTPQYMSPEQAMGERTLDARTDVYALGCVLYEMLAGEPPFTGPTAQAIVARVITEEPRSLIRQRKTVPLEVDTAVATALSKLPADRFPSAAAFAEALRGRGPTLPLHHTTSASVSARQPRRAPWLVPALGTALAATAAIAAWGWSRQAPAPSVTRSFVVFPDAEAPRMHRPSYALLPDGSAMVYVGRAASGAGTQLWIKKRSELHATPLGGSAGATAVFVPPNGEWIGYIAGTRVMKVPQSGGQPVVVGEALCNTLGCQSFPSAAFLDDGRVIFHSADALVMVRPNGGPPDSLVTSRAVAGFTPIFPSPLPGSRGVLFTACTLYCNKADVW
ncbi:MAG: serine/threonine-protein kinase, partial [Gemmatimonadaceae bacterium]